MATRIKTLSILGTRPEGIKMVPIIRRLHGSNSFDSVVVSTAQHRELLDQILKPFQITIHYDLDIMAKNQSLNWIVLKAIEGLDAVLACESPDIVLVQGDTTTAFVGALAAFYRRIPVGHVEAGLRSFDRWNPYPEEMNRRLISCLATVHFAPTWDSYMNLCREGVDADRIYLTGNTVIDCLVDATRLGIDAGTCPLPNGFKAGDGRLLLVTAHRRENWDTALRDLCLALLELTRRFPDLRVLYPVHLNPNVQGIVYRMLWGVPNIYLSEPLPYLSFVEVMKRCHIILTDSGGVQEEATALGKPVLVFRKNTERPEGVAAGNAKVIGVDQENIIAEVSQLLLDQKKYNLMANRRSPYGDGLAAHRTIQAILHYFGQGPKPDNFGVNRLASKGEIKAYV